MYYHNIASRICKGRTSGQRSWFLDKYWNAWLPAASWLAKTAEVHKTKVLIPWLVCPFPVESAWNNNMNFSRHFFIDDPN